MKQTVDLALKLGHTDIIDNLNQLHREGKLVEKTNYYKYETNKDGNVTT